MASDAAIQKRELAVLGKIQTELAFFVDRQTMSFGTTNDGGVPKEFNLENFQIVDDSTNFTPPGQTEHHLHSVVAAEEGPENLEWFSKLLTAASSAA